MQRGGNLNRLAKPHRVVGRVRAHGNRLPTALIQIHRFAVRHVAGMRLPHPIGQLVQFTEPVNRLARLRLQVRGNLLGFRGALRAHAA